MMADANLAWSFPSSDAKVSPGIGESQMLDSPKSSYTTFVESKISDKEDFSVCFWKN